MRVLTMLLAFVFAFSAFAPKASATTNKMVAVVLLMDDGDDKKVVTTIFTTLMAAEKVAKMMNVELVAAGEVNDDVFVFSLKSEEQKNLTLKMFDEEGYELAAHRVMKVEEGNSYRALNVNSLEDGTYLFQLTDAEGQELTQEVKINRKK